MEHDANAGLQCSVEITSTVLLGVTPGCLQALADSELDRLVDCHSLSVEHGEDAESKKKACLDALLTPLHRCPICLATEDLTSVPLSCTDSSCAEDAMRCSSCLAPFHRTCVGQCVLSAAENGQVPLRCPVPRCPALWPHSMAAWSLTPNQLAQYDKVLQMTQELQARTIDGLQTPALSPRSVDALKVFGIRTCPRCHVLIQKQGEGLLSGCDKMTCRCGCMFCFQCGTEARNGGVARCRCAGTHHNFIPHKEVLSNYLGTGSLGAAGDHDLTKRPKGAASQLTAARLSKELKTISRDALPYVHVSRDDTNILRWNFLIEGPPDTPYDGGWYWGRLEIPKDYPHYPPLIRMFTPNGRFETDKWLCRTVLDYHPEGWQATWSVSSLLIALLALMCDDSFTPGAVHPPGSDQDKGTLAQQSLTWNMEHREFCDAFPSLDEIFTESLERRKAQGLSMLSVPAMELIQKFLDNSNKCKAGGYPAGNTTRAPRKKKGK